MARRAHDANRVHMRDQMCVIRACKVGDGGVPYQSWSPIFGGCRFVLLFIFNAVREKRILSFTKVIKIS